MRVPVWHVDRWWDFPYGMNMVYSRKLLKAMINATVTMARSIVLLLLANPAMNFFFEVLLL